MFLNKILSLQKNSLFHIFIDLLSFISSIIFSFFLRFEFTFPFPYLEILPNILAREIPLFLILYIFIFRIHDSLWEYFSLEGLKDLTLTLTLEKLFLLILFIISYKWSSSFHNNYFLFFYPINAIFL